MVHFISITMSGHENAFCVSGPKWGESTGDQWIPSQRASNEGIWSFLCYDPEQAVLQTAELLLIWDSLILMWYPCNDISLVIPSCHLVPGSI